MRIESIIPALATTSAGPTIRTAWELFAIVAVLLIIFLAVVIALLLLRRRRRQTPASKPQAGRDTVDAWAEAGRRTEP